MGRVAELDEDQIRGVLREVPRDPGGHAGGGGRDRSGGARGRSGGTDLKLARVLVVDDDALIGHAVRRTLAPHPVDVETDPNRAVDRLMRGERFDLVLCDVHMPGLDGGDVLDAVSMIAPEMLGGFVFMTGGGLSDSERRVVASSPGGAIEKPFDPRELRRLADAAARRPERA